MLALALVVAACSQGQGGTDRAAVSVPAESGRPEAVAAGSIHARAVATGLNFPGAFTFAKSGRIYYGERSSGRIVVLDPRTGGHHLFFQVTNVVSNGEQGLLGVALPPGYPKTPFVYAYATRNVSGTLRNQIVRIRNVGGRGQSMSVIFTSSTVAGDYHDGGRIQFGPGGNLYAIVGESHSSANAQNLSVPSGKILRMTPSGGIPKNPPIPGTRIYAYGIRNSYGFDFDPATHRLWETENGPECNDEVNRIVAGRNFGWGPNENCNGTSPYDTNNSGPKPRILPKRWYTPTIAPTGLVFCRKCGLGAASNGKFFFGAYKTGDIRRVKLTPNRLGVAHQTVVLTRGNGILSMETSPNGHLYFSDSQGIYRLVLA